jgi:transcriptional regulator with XRE-family HTH domain
VSLGKIIKALRMKHGMTQKTLAIHLAVKHSAVSEYEKDKHKPSLDQVKTLARLFGTTVDELLNEEELFVRSVHLDMLPAFGERLRLLLAKSGMSRHKAAKALGISPRHLLELLQGELVPSYKVLFAIADLFSTTTDFLFGREHMAAREPEVPATESLTRLHEKITQGRVTYQNGRPLEAEDRAVLLRQIDLFELAKQVENDSK